MVINTVYHFADSDLGVEISSKKRDNRKMMPLNRGLRHLCTFVLGFQKTFSLSAFYCIFGDKK